MSYRGLFALHDFRLLFAARAISLTGSAIAPIALAFGVLGATGQPTDLGIVLFSRQAISVASLLGGGVLADRFDRRRLLVLASLASCLSEAAIGGLFLTGSASVPLLCALAAIDGMGSAVFFPASIGLMPSTVDSEQLQSANALVGFARNGSSIFGAAAGGGLVALLGPGLGIEIDALSFFVAAVLIELLHVSRAADRRERSAFVAELREGWEEFRSRTWLLAIVVQFAFVNLATSGALLVLMPLRAQRLYGGAAAYGWLLALFALGALLGGVVMLRARPRHPLFVGTIGVLAFVPELVLLGAGAPLFAVLTTAVVGGLGGEVFVLLWVTSMQQHIPADRLSRVSSYDALGSFIFTPIGVVIAAPVTVVIGLANAFWAAAALVAIPSLLVLAVRDVRRLRSLGWD